MSDFHTTTLTHRSKFWLLAAGSLALTLALTGCFGTDSKEPVNPCLADASLCTPRSKLLDTGAVIFQTCGGCHGGDGRGSAGTTPPLANSDFFMANRHKVMRIVLAGYTDSVYVNGVWYQGGMPDWGTYFSDIELAGALTYIRAHLNDSTVISCLDGSNIANLDDNGFPICEKVQRPAADTARDSVAVWEIKAVRDSICTKNSGPEGTGLGCYGG